MTVLKKLSPLVMALALIGCNKQEKAAETPAAAPATQAASVAPATAADNTATATTTNTATAAAASNMTPEQHKDAREDIMKSWKTANKTMGGMVKDPAIFNAATFKDAAAKLNQDPWVHFSADAKGGDAKDEIWSDAAGFQAEIDKYKQAVTALNTAAGTATTADGVKAQFGEVGSSCKSCHDKFKTD